MFLSGLNCIRKFQFDLENLISSRYRSNAGFLLEIKVLFQKITEETVILQNSILKQFKHIEFLISKQDFILSGKTEISEELSELSAVQFQFNIIIEIQVEIEKKLRKKKWFLDKLELTISIPSLCPEPELRPKLQSRKPKRKIGNETGTKSQNDTRGPDKLISSQNLVTEYNPKKKSCEVLEMAEIEVDTFSQKIDSSNIPSKLTFHQQTNKIINKQEQLSQEISKNVDMTLPFSSLSLNNNLSQEIKFPTNLFDFSQTADTTLMLEENIDSQINENETEDISLSQELIPIENIFKKNKKNPEKKSSQANHKLKIDEKPLFSAKKQEIVKLHPSCDNRITKSLKGKFSQPTEKLFPQQPNIISKKFSTKLQDLNHTKTFHKQSSILKYVSPPRNRSIIHDKSSDCKSFPLKTNYFSGEDHQTKPNQIRKLKSTNSNNRDDGKLLNRPFYSMNILMIQREEIIYNFPDSFWTSGNFPDEIISQFESDLDFC